MKKKSLLVLGISSILSLVACGGGHTPTQVDQKLPEDDPVTPVKIMFWHCLGHEKRNNLQKVVDEFNTQYQGQYYVDDLDLNKVAGDYDSLHETIKTKLAAGEVPAIAMGYPDSFSEYISSDMSYSKILRLNYFFDDETFGYSQAEKDDFVKAFYDEGTSYQFEGTWSVPMYKSTEVMYYNRSYFYGCSDINAQKFASNQNFLTLYNKVVGTTSEKDPDYLTNLQQLKTWLQNNGGYTYEVPTKWNDMFILAAQMKADRVTEGGTVATKEFYPVGYDSDANLMISQMAQRGIPYTVNDEASKANPVQHFQFVSPEAKALATELKGYIDAKTLITKGSLGGSTYTNTYFNEAKTVMAIGSTGGSSYNISGNFDVALAAVPYSGSTPKYIQQGPSICFFDNENGYINKGAWLFYKKLADPETNAKIALENSYDPVRTSSYETQSYLNWVALAGQGLKYDIPNITQTLKQYYMTSPTFIGSGTARDEIGSIIKYMCLSNYTVDEAFSIAYGKCVAAVS